MFRAISTRDVVSKGPKPQSLRSEAVPLKDAAAEAAVVIESIWNHVRTQIERSHPTSCLQTQGPVSLQENISELNRSGVLAGFPGVMGSENYIL